MQPIAAKAYQDRRLCCWTDIIRVTLGAAPGSGHDHDQAATARHRDSRIRAGRDRRGHQNRR